MKPLILILVVFLLVGGGIALITFLGDRELDGRKSDVQTDNEYYQEIETTIGTLKEGRWNRKEYQRIKELIRAYQSENLIDGDESDLLNQSLEVGYIYTLNDAARRFFSSSDNRSELGPINQELRRYERDSRFRAQVGEMRGACGNFYELVGWDNNGFREGIDGEIQRYVRDREYDEETTDSFIKDLDRYGKQEYLRESAIVNDFVNSRQVLLDQHFQAHRLFNRVMGRSNINCNQKYGRFQFYEAKCETVLRERRSKAESND